MDSLPDRFPLVRYLRLTIKSIVHCMFGQQNLSQKVKTRATRGTYQKLSAEKKTEIGKKAAECGASATLRFYSSKLPVWHCLRMRVYYYGDLNSRRTGQTTKFIQRNTFCDQSTKFKYREIKALYGMLHY